MIKDYLAIFRPVKLPYEVKNRKGEILLHIGDVPVWGYPYIKRLIRKIKPDVLVHTGDLADNYKVGRIPEHIPAYKRWVKSLIYTMEKYAKEVYIVPGNNDLEDYIREVVAKSKIVKPNMCIKIRGIPFLLCHRVQDIDGKAKFYLYGHGPTGDNHSFYDNSDGKCYSNVFFAPAVIFLEDETCVGLTNYNGGLKR